MKYMLIIFKVSSYLIDYIVFYVFVYLLAYLGVLGYALSFLIFFLYRYLTTSFLGATPGMMIFKLRLSSYSLKICLKRELYRFASALFYTGYIYALFDPDIRTLHDVASQVCVHMGEPEEKSYDKKPVINIIAGILLVISAIRWVSYFVINDVGLIGLKKIYASDEYFQSFDGDNLLSLSADELYLKTLGRRYTAVVDINSKPALIRISNKIKYTEIYRLNLNSKGIIGQYLYKINMPLQFISSGNFRGTRDLCAISPGDDMVLVDGNGSIYGRGKTNIKGIVNLKCGDMDGDGQDEAVVLGRDGNVEVFKYMNTGLKDVYFGKIGEDIVPYAFYIDNGIVVAAEDNDDRDIIYSYGFKYGKFFYRDKRYIKIRGISNMVKLDDEFIASHVFRNSMIFRRGSIQVLGVYAMDNRVNRIYNFGIRPGRIYAYSVRTLEDAADLDGDGKKEIILKAVGGNDVMGNAYRLEIYRMERGMLAVNRILSKFEEILYYNN